MLAITLVSTIGFAVAVHEFFEVLEDELLERTLTRELASLAVNYHHGAEIEGKRGHSGRVFVLPANAPVDRLPTELGGVKSPHPREIHIDHRKYIAARRLVDGASIYLVISLESVDALEDRLETIGWLTLGAAVLLALIIAVVFSWLILRPVRALATRLAAFRPGHSQQPIAHEYSDREMRTIAESFDMLIERLHDFVDRERAFTQDASHELRTPLAIALNASELLLEQSELSARTRDRAERVHTACVRMHRLVSALLFLARGNDARGEHCNVNTVLKDVISFYDNRIKEKGLSIEVDSSSVSVAAPAGVIDCVLHNLIDNAIEHTTHGMIAVHVDQQRIIVRDSGSGITPEAQRRIFDRRYRSGQSQGLGIGLYLVQQICSRLGWATEIDSTPGTGTIFTITLA